MNTRLFLSAALALPLVVTGLQLQAAEPQAQRRGGAENQAQRRTTQMRFAGMDRNGDGEITRQEWRGSQNSFDVHDWNNDNRLSGDEVRVGAWQATGETADHDPSRAEQTLTWTQAKFNSIDHNRDRRITDNEWHYDSETFIRVDRNRDGSLTQAEFLGADMDDDRGDQFDDLDLNSDNRLQRSEWHASDDAFDWLDRNRDGILSRVEVTGSNERRAALNTADRVVVSAQEQWNDSGITVRQGDVLLINATGTIQLSPQSNDKATPGQSLTNRRAPGSRVNAEAGVLLGRVGNSAPFVIGDSRQVTMPQSGRLFLGVNDDHWQDNSGQFEVAIALRNP